MQLFSKNNFSSWLFLLASVSLLSGCSSGTEKMNTLRNYINNPPKYNNTLKKIPKKNKYAPESYSNSLNKDPFMTFSEAMLRKESLLGGHAKIPLQKGILTPLQKYPISTLSLKGVIISPTNQVWAILETPKNTVYKATLGTPVGVHEGKIIKINHTVDHSSVIVMQYLKNAFGEVKKENFTISMDNPVKK